jgi:putative ABC transport system permease protein
MIFFSFAMRNLRRHWVRSMLSAIGIIIGVIAIASLGIMGNSINLLVANIITDVGDTIVIVPHTAASSDVVAGDPRLAVDATISADQVAQITRVAGSYDVIPVLQSADEITFGDEAGYAQVMGLAVEDIPLLLEVEDGQLLRRNVPGVLVGTFLAGEFGIAAGNRIRIGGEEVRVTGILAERGYAADINPDYGIVVSREFYRDHFGVDDEFSMVVIKVRDIEAIDSVKEAVDHQLNRREQQVDIFDSRDLLEMYEEIYDQITTFLVAIGAVSLVVAAVNILNVMYISVTERIHEIGIMRSIGTLRAEVLRMFLYEAMILGIIGSIIGGIFSTIAGYLISVYAIQAFTVGTTFGENATVFNATSVAYIIFAMAFGIGISTASGLYPAWKASRMTPIEALRHE